MYDMVISQLSIVGDVAIAMVLGAVIGYEREAADKPAGLRTHMLMCAASALFLHIGYVILDQASDASSAVRVDPIRVVEAVVTGVSFLGAGTILRHRRGEERVEGLTTGASLLFVAAIGLAVALGQYALAVAGAVLVLGVLRAGKWLEK